MTNHWVDIGNASLVFVMGANPAENHPACMRHINNARFDLHKDDAGNPVSFGRTAKLVVVDPRQTRTALQRDESVGDMYVRIRPGTDIAFMNGLMKWIFDDFDGTHAVPYSATAASNFMKFHNGTTGVATSVTDSTDAVTSGARAFVDNTGTSRTLTAAELAGVTGFGASGAGTNRGWPKYTDARCIVHDPASAADVNWKPATATATQATKTALKPGTLELWSGAGKTGTKYTEGVDYTVDMLTGLITRKDPGSIPMDGTTITYVSYSYNADDYERQTLTTASGWQFSNMLVFANSITDAGTVYMKLKSHLAPYDLTTVADICGCTEAQIIAVAKAHIDNCRMSDGTFLTTCNKANGADPTKSTYRAATHLYAMGGTQHTVGSQNIRAYAMLSTMLGNMGRPGGGINALRGIHNVQGSTDMGVLFDSIPAYSGNPGTATTGTVGDAYTAYSNTLFGNRVTGNTLGAFASGTVAPAGTNNDLVFTAKTIGTGGNSITITYVDPGTASAPLSVGVVGSAITVNLATDASAPTPLITTTAAQVKAAVDGDVNAAALVAVANVAGNDGTGIVTAMAAVTLAGGINNGTNYAYTPAKLGLQQRGFYNMTREWFGNTDVTAAADFDALYACWPKGNGVDHITAFRQMQTIGATAPVIKALVNWGQNPAVTEPNQSAVRKGLEELDLLVCVDMFANETAECSRKTGGITYLLPACSHVEEAGSVTNSGRWLQWRQRATTPRGNSRTDLELMIKFAKALNTRSAFSHIQNQWKTLTNVASLYNGGAGADPFTVLYAKYGYDGVSRLDTTTNAEDPAAYTYKGTALDGALGGSEWVADRMCWETNRPLDYSSTTGKNDGGTMWIYSGNGTAAGYTTSLGNFQPDLTSAGGPAWTVYNRAKSRNNSYQGTARTVPRWGFAWLLNRRVFYNNGEVPQDVADNYVAPGLMARMFTMNAAVTLADWSAAYRAYNKLNDVASTQVGSTTHVLSGRFPAHCEPYESPRDAAFLAKWGYNTSNGTSLLKSDGLSPRGTVATYPLVLTTIRCVEHFQGGPITRNNSWNVESEPVPWIELNSIDAGNAGIVDGDWVNVITARSNSTTEQEARTPNAAAGWAQGFRARVGSGLQSNQRVAPGVVAIPWHWGDQGLGTGSRANDLCIDAWDANTIIPESKACLCRIVKL